MDTRVSPLARREEQRYRVKRVGRRTLGRGVTRGEQGIIKGERFTTLVWNSYALRTYHCLRSESFKEPLLTRSSLSLSLSLLSFLSLFCALLSDNRKGRGADGANKRYPAPFVIELLVLPLDVLLKNHHHRPGEGKPKGLRGYGSYHGAWSMEYRSRGFTGNGYEKKMDMRLKRATAPSSRLITIPFPLEIAARRKGDRADLAVEQSVPTNPWQHSSSPFFVWRWRRYHSPDASRWNYCQP